MCAKNKKANNFKTEIKHFDTQNKMTFIASKKNT